MQIVINNLTNRMCLIFSTEFAKYRPYDPYKEKSLRNQASKVGPLGGEVKFRRKRDADEEGKYKNVNERRLKLNVLDLGGE